MLHIMKRRHFLQLAVTGLAGCGGNRKAGETALKTGPFRITVPESWIESAIIEKTSMMPVYSPADWAAYQQDSKRILKPSYECRPQHWAMRFPAALPMEIPFQPESAGADPTAPQILIHKADEWAVVPTDGNYAEKPASEVLAELRKNLETAMDDPHPPRFPVFMDAFPDFVCLKKHILFSGGRGVRMIAQWNSEPSLMTLGNLHYLFTGMSDDNSCQIMASFPLDLPGLPRAEDETHLGHSIKNYQHFSQDFDTYVASAVAWLRENESKITPSLTVLDQVMQSLVAPRWK
jgi:hypothetical protein